MGRIPPTSPWRSETELSTIPPPPIVVEVYPSAALLDPRPRRRNGIQGMARQYWLDLFTGTTWAEFLKAGGGVSGFRESRWTTVKRIGPGDYLLCYLTGISRFIGILEVTSEPYREKTPIWENEAFPCRFKVKSVVTLTPETAVPIHELRDRLSIFENLKSPHAWTGRLRGSPAKWKVSDGEAILRALLDAKEDPVSRPVDPKKLARRPKSFRAKIGPVTVPGVEPVVEDETEVDTPPLASSHTEIQHQLLRLGSAMGFTVWVARNDKNREFKGRLFSEQFDLLGDLPLSFDEATTRTIEYIDVLWLKGNAIVAAFEVESTTSIYSGLLRMSDLLSMQPNLNIPLYLVAPDDRREKVFVEVNRPTFSRLTPPLSEVVRFISFDTLRTKIKEVSTILRFLKPEFLEELSEECSLDEP